MNKYISILTICIVITQVTCSQDETQCVAPNLAMDGDVILGGIFDIHISSPGLYVFPFAN